MPLVTPNNNYLAGIDKQTDEATVGTVADYSFPTFAGASIGPVFDTRRVEVTDASSIQGDVAKGPTSWTAEVTLPAYADSLGRFLQALYPTDTKTGAGPWTHAFSGFGGTQPWLTMYAAWPGAANKRQSFGKGLATGIGFTATADQTPLQLRFGAVGQTVQDSAWTATIADDNSDGFFTLQTAGAKIELDLDTPNVNPAVAATNVQDVTINIDRPATAVPTADGVTVSNISAGKGAPGGTMTLLYNSWDAYNATYFGAVAGTSASATKVQGALELTFVHSITPAWTFVLYMPAVVFQVAIPTPGVDGGPFTQSVTLLIEKPTTGDHVVPTLINGQTLTY